eukprot:3661739-Prymnesium_polylepis.1
MRHVCGMPQWAHWPFGSAHLLSCSCELQACAPGLTKLRSGHSGGSASGCCAMPRAQLVD